MRLKEQLLIFSGCTLFSLLIGVFMSFQKYSPLTGNVYFSTAEEFFIAVICFSIFLYIAFISLPRNKNFICPKCEEIFERTKEEEKYAMTCPHCDVPLVPLKGFYKNKKE